MAIRTFLVALAFLVTPLQAKAAPSVRSVVFTGRLSATGTLTALVSLRAEGEDQLHINRGLDAALGPQRRILAQVFAAEQVGDPAVDVELEEDPPATAGDGLRYRLTVGQFASLTERSTARPLPRLFVTSVTDAWSPEALATDGLLSLGGPLTLSERTTIDFDPSWDLLVGKPVAIDRPFASYESSYTVQGTRLTVSRRVEIKLAEVDGRLRPELVAFANAVRADLDARVTWRRRDPFGAQAALTSLDAAQLCEASRQALERGDYEGARDLARRARTKDPDSTEAWLLIGRSEIGLDHPAEAEAALEKVIELGTPDEGALMTLGQFYIGEKRWADAAEVFQQAVQRNPENPRAQERLGQSLGLLGRHEESIAPLRAYVEAEPDDVDGYYALGGAYNFSGHPEQARDTLIKGLARPAGASTRLRLAMMLAEEGLDTSTARRIAGETLAAAASACRAVTLDRTPADYGRHLTLAAQSYRVLGMAAAVDGDAAALDLLRVSFDILPHPQTAVRIARVLARRDRSQEAFRYFALSVREVEPLTFDGVPDELRPWARKTYGTVEALRSAVQEQSRDRLFLRRLHPAHGTFKMPKGAVKASGVTLKARVLVGEDGAIEDSRLEGGSEPYRSAARSDLARVKFPPVGPVESRFKTLRTIEFFYLPTPEVRAFWEFELAGTDVSD